MLSNYIGPRMNSPSINSVNSPVAHCSSIFHLIDDPRLTKDSYVFIDNGMLVVENGIIIAAGERNEIEPTGHLSGLLYLVAKINQIPPSQP